MVRTCLKISAIAALLLSANVVGMEEPNEEDKKCQRTPPLPVAELPAEILSNPAGRGGHAAFVLPSDAEMVQGLLAYGAALRESS